MEVEQLRILLIEDNPDHAALVKRRLIKAEHADIQVVWNETFAEGVASLESDAGYDAILLDLSLPDSTLAETLPAMLPLALQCPILVLTSLDEREVALKAVRQGAQDFLVKSHISGELLLRAIRHAIDRKKTERQLRQYSEELERSNRDLEQFASIISHDLNAPLRAISGFLQLLSSRYQDALDSDANEFIDAAVEGSKRMRSMIEALREYSRVATNSRSLRSTSLEAALEGAVANLSRSIEERKVIIHRQPLPMVIGDDAQLMQLFQNLIENAMKYCKQEVPELWIGAELKQGMYHISVRDNGIGMDAKHLERIFLIFQRLHTDEEYSGRGIGLSVCKRIVERHDGSIWAESEVGVGTTFFFTLMPLESGNNPTNSPGS